MGKLIFFHNGDITAKICYNFDLISDVFIVIPETPPADLPEEILFYKENDFWTTASEIKNFPATLQSLISSIDKYFEKEILWDHRFALLNFLS
mgnify:CR=1 FL=1